MNVTCDGAICRIRGSIADRSPHKMSRTYVDFYVTIYLFLFICTAVHFWWSGVYSGLRLFHDYASTAEYYVECVRGESNTMKQFVRMSAQVPRNGVQSCASGQHGVTLALRYSL
jgi:hypothetical protein